MTPHALQDISKLEDTLWEAADQLRANSKLTSSEYCMPILGIIFLRHATNRYNAVAARIEEEKASGKLPKKLPITKAHFISRRALMLPEDARYETLLKLPKGSQLGPALVKAMDAIEEDFVPLAGQLPKDYEKFDNDLLEKMLRIFDSEILRQASGDVFGRIYEYFLMKFAIQGAQDNGEFFTPPSLVQTIVNVIEPDHGVVADLACGSGGMFVQTSHFMEDHGQNTMERVTFYGQEKTATTIRLAKMNLAVHGLEGEIREANTFYEDEHRLSDGRPLWGNCDFMMANPPFNVDMVDAGKVKTDRRLPFGLPGVNKGKTVSNANYLWISYFHSYLNAKGRAGFVMSSQASSAGHTEAEVRRKIVETGDVDVMMSIRSNFFYTRTVPCELWFFDKGKPAERKDQVLMLDARNVYRKVTRKIYDFSAEQQQNLAAIVWLYRGETDRFRQLLSRYDDEWRVCRRSLDALMPDLKDILGHFPSDYKVAYYHLKRGVEMDDFIPALSPMYDTAQVLLAECENLPLVHQHRDHAAAETRVAYLADGARIRSALQNLLKLAAAARDKIRPHLDREHRDLFEGKCERLQHLCGEAMDLLSKAAYWIRQIDWLSGRFPSGR
ncbi:MAG: Type restriction-modification system, DNA-methyltransferase subunit, partial [Verrucomicrobiales bacterium]|nr:Type restriction-modification system, DNA-methyltransferase subunit [Verrucomicrobiales bacterium]